MRNAAFIGIGITVGLLLVGIAAHAQQHRATLLGNPATRFAPPLKTTVDLRLLFRDEKLRPDIASILQQWGWTGNLEDLYHAAYNAEISEWEIPVGSRMPFMSSREHGKPVTLRDVLWAGDAPAPAYAFTFASNGRRYRCITPKACSNFFLVDLGADIPELQLTADGPAGADTCTPFEMRLVVRNDGTVPAPQVRITQTLAPGLRTTDNQSSFELDAGNLQPGEAREHRFQVMALAAGNHVSQTRVTATSAAAVETTSTVLVRTPALSLDCTAPAEMLVGLPAEVCLTLRNVGDATEPRTTITIPLPEGATVAKLSEGGISDAGSIRWEFLNFAPGAIGKVCASLTTAEPGTLEFAATAVGSCAKPVRSICATRMDGIPAILLDAVDLEDPVQVGHDVTYVINVTNQGSAPGTNVRLVCTLPDSQQFVSGVGPTPVHNSGQTVTTEPLPHLAPKSVATWRVVAKALRPDDARFSLDLSSDQFQRPILEEESTTQD